MFIDFNQNSPHKTVFGAWCVRPRAGAQVSTPLAWDELDTIDPALGGWRASRLVPNHRTLDPRLSRMKGEG